MKEAMFYQLLPQEVVQCMLCPHQCVLSADKTGLCGVRTNQNGKLVASAYEMLSAVHFDPIEKKPLFHFFPGSEILSIGSVGCNFKCQFCQNHEISQITAQQSSPLRRYSSFEIGQLAKRKKNNLGIAFTYNEPLINFEYILEVAQEVQRHGLKTVLVTNGYVNSEPLDILLQVIDACNVDLKSFSSSFYRTYVKADLDPVKSALIQIREAGVHLEITFLVIPGLNDNEAEFIDMCHWIADNLGAETALHISRYFPAYKMQYPATPVEVMLRMYDLAHGILDFVCIGNVEISGKANTLCPHCGTLLIRRLNYHVTIEGLNEVGCCSVCGWQVLPAVNLSVNS